MTVFIFEKDAFDKIIAVEGAGYSEQQENFGECSFNAFLEQWKKETNKNPELKKVKDLFVGVNGNYSIYGLGGFNRYGVLYSGEIIFSREQAVSHEQVIRAGREGFRIFSPTDK